MLCHKKEMKDITNTKKIYSDESKGTEPQQNEVGGPKGPEPTRYGDWEQKGRCTDF